jgi:ABC-2 type transport system ATP-binding protein
MTPTAVASSSPVLELEGLEKRYGTFEGVRGISLQVYPGEIYGFLGPNGAGKTSTIRMVAGVIEPSGGRIRVGGIDTRLEPEAAKRRVGYIPDRPFLYEKLSGAEFLRFVAALWGSEGPAVEERIDEYLELFSLTPWKDELLENYSHGMRQKILITSAFLHDPELVVVDEPMVGLDPRSARILKELLRDYVRRGGAVFLSTHTLEVAEALCDRIAILRGGSLVAEGTMESLRGGAGKAHAGLEEIFLEVTGGAAVSELVGALSEGAS